MAYSACLSSHGVPNTPASKGGILLRGNSDTDSLKAAGRACKALLPKGGAPKRLTEAQRASWLSYSACMRKHGVPNFPDPTFVDNDTGIKLDTRGIDPHSPLLQAAAKACEKAFPLRALREFGQS